MSAVVAGSGKVGGICLEVGDVLCYVGYGGTSLRV